MTRPARNQRTPAVAPKKGAEARAPRGPRTPVAARLSAWRDQHFYSFFSSLGRLTARPWATALTVLVLGFALALPLLFWLVYANARDLSGGLREAREVTVFLKSSADAKVGEVLAGELRKRADVTDVVLHTPEQGLAEFRQLSGFGEALDALQSNPLPTVLVVTPRESLEADNPALVAELKSDPRVDLVQYDAEWRRKLSGILHFTERVVAVVAALLAFATLLVIGNTVRMDIQARSMEISVMQTIGAGNAFVRRPFLYAGFWYGLFGSLLALLIVVTVEFALADPIGRLLDSYTNRFELHGVGIASILVVVAASGLLGWIGAFIVTTRHLAAGRPR
ncbi:MAG: permease-like cell division protein FtsX [Dokdonella sp.]|uniref:permease-like cell division protein FtsX n=1 Tax=Dokdonella sp. TaxID=2291710 RepID=UPI003266BBE9